MRLRAVPPTPPGRETEMALLTRYLERAVAGDQQLVLLQGDPGVGKTTLLQGFARAARRGSRPPRVFYLQATAGEAYQPVHHAALAATSRRLYARLGGKKQATEMARGLVGEWLGVIPVWGNLLGAIAATADAVARRKRQRAFEEIDTSDEDIIALLDASRRRPLVLLLDELERADEDAIARLAALIETADEGARILIVGAYRPTAPGVPDPPVHSLRRTLPHKGEFFLHLTLEALGSDAGRPAPDLTALPAGTADLVRAASVFGPVFDATALASLVESDELTVEDQLAVAVRYGLLDCLGEIELGDGDVTTSYRFASPRLQAALQANLASDERSLLLDRLTRVRSGAPADERVLRSAGL